MNASSDTDKQTPPNFFTILRGGFDVTANHIYLILFPVGLDLLIWLGPHLHLTTLLKEFSTTLLGFITSPPPELAGQNQAALSSPENLQVLKTFLAFMTERYNLMIYLRSYPVGIPSFMSGKLPVGSPLGSYPIIDLTSMGSILLIVLGLSALGLVLGIFYYQVVAQAALNGKVDWVQALQRWPAQALSSLGLGAMMLFGALAAMVPFLCLSALSAGALSFLSSLLYTIVLVGVLYPLVFVGHAIAYDNQNLFTALRSSFRLARLTLPVTSLFFLVVFLIIQATQWLWAAPADDSWLALIAIAGHGFVTTGLLAATFIYYRSAGRWLQALLRVLA